MICLDLVPEPTDERQASEAGHVVGLSGTFTRLVAGTTRSPVFMRRAASLLRQLHRVTARRRRLRTCI